MRSIRSTRQMAVFHWIEMDVVHMPSKIAFVLVEVFPMPALPDAAFSCARPAGAPAFPLGDMPRKSRFDEHPPFGVVRIARRQSPHCMQMPRQNHHGVDVEGMSLFRYADNLAEDVTVLYQQGLARSARFTVKK
jgi:hypothetical protein